MKRKALPPSSRGSTQIRPSCFSTIRLQIVRPMPVPGMVAPVQALEHLEDVLCLVRSHTGAVVLDAELPMAVHPLRVHVHLGVLGVPVLDGVRDQVLEQLREQGGLARGRWAGLRRAASAPRSESRRFRPSRASRTDAVAVHELHAQLGAAHARVFEQRVDHSLHPLHAVHGGVDEAIGLRVELARVAAL